MWMNVTKEQWRNYMIMMVNFTHGAYWSLHDHEQWQGVICEQNSKKRRKQFAHHICQGRLDENQGDDGYVEASNSGVSVG